MRFIPVKIRKQRRLLTVGAGWVIHPASAGEERKQSWSSVIVIFHQKEADHIGGADQSSVPRGLRWQSQPLPPNIKGPMVRGPRHMTEIQRLGSAPVALQAQKGTGPVRKSTCRSQSQHFAIRSFLREVRRAKPLMSWRRLYLRKSAKLRFRMCYILSIERQLLR